ncbi:MAG: zinc ribbon domain-containing protein [Sulfuricellaceae bacterium]|nr:zinc ribbon domain-containing protein [Sulfuricellaceae bacterium]
MAARAALLTNSSWNWCAKISRWTSWWPSSGAPPAPAKPGRLDLCQRHRQRGSHPQGTGPGGGNAGNPCPKCGSANANEARFCQQCGTPLRGAGT